MDVDDFCMDSLNLFTYICIHTFFTLALDMIMAFGFMDETIANVTQVKIHGKVGHLRTPWQEAHTSRLWMRE